MTVAQLKAVRPAVHRIAGKEWLHYVVTCTYADNPVTVWNVRFNVCYAMPKGKVEQVILESDVNGVTSPEQIKSALTEKYGRSISDTCEANAVGNECHTIWRSKTATVELEHLDFSNIQNDTSHTLNIRYRSPEYASTTDL
jgi:hypothetical protein